MPIFLDDRPFEVTANLAFALDFTVPSHLSGVPFRTDAIYISQADLKKSRTRSTGPADGEYLSDGGHRH